MHGRFACTAHTGRRPTVPRDAEREADAFASAFLMPPDDLTAEIPYVRSLTTLIDKKSRWGVSVAALNYSLHKLGRVSDWTYRSFCIALSKMGREKEPNPMPRETSQILQKVLTDLWKNGISLSRVAKQLEIPEKEINALLFGIAASPLPPNHNTWNAEAHRLAIAIRKLKLRRRQSVRERLKALQGASRQRLELKGKLLGMMEINAASTNCCQLLASARMVQSRFCIDGFCGSLIAKSEAIPD